MQVITVESTALATVGYDEARERLQVEFGGRAWSPPRSRRSDTTKPENGCR